jgi:phage replication-related protein YjqB (UPF0714/DUF867 family)
MILKALVLLLLPGAMQLAKEIPREESAKRLDNAPCHVTELGAEKSRDGYNSFAELSRHEKEGVDFRINLRSGTSGIAVVAPHGGGIEPGTTRIARAIAGGEHTFYSFEGLKVSGNKRLHLTSTQFDEPIGINAIKAANAVLAIHGCKEPKAVIYIGGLNLEFRKRISEVLELAGFTVGEHAGLMGGNPQNLCNRGKSGGGVQLEVSSGLRHLMFAELTRQGREKTTSVFHRFVTAVRQAIADD